MSELPTDLAGWLSHVEGLHARPIDMGLARVQALADRLGLSFDCPVITVGGTNGKGSTCAYLEAILGAAGYRTGLYTSPHLLRFNERAQIAGVPVADADLLPHFAAVEAARGDTTLTYFEFTTLAIMRLLQQARLDVVILEVGLGGRLDAVNIIDADCAIVTSIAIDHAEYLGDTREKIGWEKAHIFRPGRPAICSDPEPPQSLIDHALAIGADLWLFGRDFNYAGDRQQWSYGGRQQRRNSLAYPALRGANQLLNASGALAALEALRDRLPVPAQAVRLGLARSSLPGRFQSLPGQPAVVLDVGHNPHAIAHLVSNLDQMGFFPYTWGVFGMLGDKDIDASLELLRNHIDHWLLCDLPGSRGRSADDLAQALARHGIRPGPERRIETFPRPRDALRYAKEHAATNDRIVVFGSFLMVADVLATDGPSPGVTVG